MRRPQVGAFSVIVQLCRLIVYSTSPHTALGPDWRGCVIPALHNRMDWAGMATCGRVSGFYKFVCSGEGHLDGDNRMLCKECKL